MVFYVGKTKKGCYVFGLPGNPVSVQTCFRLFVDPLIKKLSGYKITEHQFLRLDLLEDLPSRTPRENYIPGRLESDNDKTGIRPVHIKGSGDFSNLGRSHGLIKAPAEHNLLKSGTKVDFLPWGEHWLIN